MKLELKWQVFEFTETYCSFDKQMLNEENYKDSFLIDGDWLCGVAEERPNSGSINYLAYILSQSKGDYIGCHKFSNLDAALSAISKLNRKWELHSMSSCSEDGCGGDCKSCEKICALS